MIIRRESVWEKVRKGNRRRKKIMKNELSEFTIRGH